MEKQFVPYELAVKLKELGFDEKCFGYYNSHRQLRYQGQVDPLGGMDVEEMSNTSLNSKYCSSPLWQQAFDWFLNEKSHFSYIRIFNHYDFGFSILKVDAAKATKKELLFSSNYYTYYEEARSACLEKLIELITNK